jgi:predicted aspartyl protease
VVEIKDKEMNPDSKSDSENTCKRHIIDADPIAIVTTTTIQPEEPIDPEEGEHLFHSQMWVNGTPLHFIVDRGSQKNLISTEVIKQLGLSTTPHPHPYNIGWLFQR